MVNKGLMMAYTYQDHQLSLHQQRFAMYPFYPARQSPQNTTFSIEKSDVHLDFHASQKVSTVQRNRLQVLRLNCQNVRFLQTTHKYLTESHTAA